MFAKYTGEPNKGLEVDEIYYINISEEYKEYRRLTVKVGDYWFQEYANLTSMIQEWEVVTWVKL